ncbi:MAG: DUF1622 domain-containing protein [Yoonia sp.]
MSGDAHNIFLDTIALSLEVMGVLAIAAGAAFALAEAARNVVRRSSGKKVYDLFRTRLAKSILIGVEFLIAADIVGTVIVEPTAERLAVLGLIVLIRTFLSFTLEVEIEGRWPWQRKSNRHEED